MLNAKLIESHSQVSSQLRSMFRADQPAGLRIFAVLEGNMPGRVFADDPARPSWAVVHETVYGTIYPNDDVPNPVLAELITELRREGEVMIGLWPDDARIGDLLALQPAYDGRVFDFSDRDTDQEMKLAIPDGCELRPVDAELYKRLTDYDPRQAETALEKGMGFCLMRGDEILCEAFAGLLTGNTLEIGVTTPKPYQGKGYATLTCAHLIRACEARGLQTYWNCNGQNVASMKLARKLGYRTEKEYRLLYWSGGH